MIDLQVLVRASPLSHARGANARRIRKHFTAFSGSVPTETTPTPPKSRARARRVPVARDAARPAYVCARGAEFGPVVPLATNDARPRVRGPRGRLWGAS